MGTGATRRDRPPGTLPPAEAEPTPHLHVGRYLPALLILGLAVHVLLPRLTNFADAVRVLDHLRPWAVAMAVLAQVLSYWGSGYLLRALVALAGRQLSAARGALITLGAASIGLVAGGLVGNAAASYRWARRSGAGAEGALLAGWLPTVFNSAALVVISVLGLLQLLALHELSAWQVAGFVTMLVLLLVLAAAGWWATRNRERATAWLSATARWWRSLRRRPSHEAAPAAPVDGVFDAVAGLGAGGWRTPALGAFANMAFDAMTLLFLFVAAGHAVSPGILLAGYGLPLLLGRLSFFLPGGVGVVEVTMVALYGGLGVPVAVAVLVIIAYRLLSFWIPTLLGFPVALYLNSITRPRRGVAARPS